jgi:ABC-type Zn uptake system ZnuABC Zn-binding protein ZnuA
MDGHAHGLANPHYWLDPRNAEVITGAIVQAMSAVAPQLANRFASLRTDFLARLEARLASWQEVLAPHRGTKLIAYHNTWPYFARRFRLDVLDVIESKEGVAPSPARIAKLAGVIRAQNVRAILHEPFAPDDSAQLLARRTGASVLKLAPSVGSLPEVREYVAIFEYNVTALARALSVPLN